MLDNDYEINWHLKNLRSKVSPTSEELKSRSVKVKNRRLAYLNKLIHDGTYFSEDAMREREPYCITSLWMINTNGAQPSREQHNEGAIISQEEKEDMMNQFTYIMHQKFLSGEDHQHLDYSKIDDDETLDDHWLREASHDAEDKYFAEDD
ncbi:hypothetical protein GH714_000257 [Hevea brasiliensis]|uniref:CCD97-like C-terminal domain-containing protein n=1 Tax=Hevea brasiliensis TaxID=3981 RepID=A0A6A6M8T0_HEVBR|nr:hypothetical protein GH714_000257 [Hevea brasiliensis]